MFEATTLYEKRLLNLVSLVNSLIAAQPDDVSKHLNQPYRDFMVNELHFKREHADGVLGKAVVSDDNVDPGFLRNLLALNLGRTAFNAEMKGSELEGAIGTKSFGKKYVPWLKSLPNMDAAWAADMPTGFYQDTTSLRSVTDLPLLHLIINTGPVIYVCQVRGANVALAQLYVTHIPETFNWFGAREELFFYRGELTKLQLLEGLAKALVAEGRTSMAVPSEFEGFTFEGLDVIVAGNALELVDALPREDAGEVVKEINEQIAEDLEAEAVALRSNIDNLGENAEAPIGETVEVSIDQAALAEAAEKAVDLVKAATGE